MSECRERQLRALGLEVTITPASAYTQNPRDDSGFEMRRIATGEGTQLIEARPRDSPVMRYATTVITDGAADPR